MNAVTFRRNWLYAHQRRPVRMLGPIVGDLYDAQAGCCFHCLRFMDPWPWSSRHKNGWTREHVTPRSVGGVSTGNVVLAHKHCNEVRSSKQLSLVDVVRSRVIIAAVMAKRGGWR